MKTAAELLKSRPHQSAYTITPETSVLDALKVMADKDVGALLVMEGDKLAGIVSERDYARKVALMSRTSPLTAVREIMTSTIICVQPTQTTEDCMVLMAEHRLRHCQSWRATSCSVSFPSETSSTTSSLSRDT